MGGGALRSMYVTGGRPNAGRCEQVGNEKGRDRGMWDAGGKHQGKELGPEPVVV
jgi:hypothetical protein